MAKEASWSLRGNHGKGRCGVLQVEQVKGSTTAASVWQGFGRGACIQCRASEVKSRAQESVHLKREAVIAMHEVRQGATSMGPNPHGTSMQEKHIAVQRKVLGQELEAWIAHLILCFLSPGFFGHLIIWLNACQLFALQLLVGL